MVGLRVFDVGALIVWLVWFFRLRDDDDDDGDDFRGGATTTRTPVPAAPRRGLRVPLPDAKPWPVRRRDHLGGVEPRPRPRAAAASRAPSRRARPSSAAEHPPELVPVRRPPRELPAPARAASSSAASSPRPSPRPSASAAAKQSPGP